MYLQICKHSLELVYNLAILYIYKYDIGQFDVMLTLLFPGPVH